MVIVVAEGAGRELLSGSMQDKNQQDPSGNKLLPDVGLWLSQKIKVLIYIVDVSHSPICWYTVCCVHIIVVLLQEHFKKQGKLDINLKYIGSYK